MSKTFREWNLGQDFLLPPSVHDFVPAGHLSRFVVALVTEELDLSGIMTSYKGEKGQPPYHPTMMVALLLYAYAVGIYSSRRIARACAERVDFMAIVALEAPDFRTISEFRRRHLKALAGLFLQVLKLCERAGLVTLGHVALDGTKIKANASKHKAMSYEYMKKREAELQAEVDGWLNAAEAADAAEDKAFGPDKRGDELPDWVADKQARLVRIREARAELEAEAKAKAHAEQAARGKKDDKPGPGHKAAPPSEEPEPKAQRNFTDAESRIIKTKDGYIQGYNAQAAVDADNQIIVAHTLSNNGSDQPHFAPLLNGIGGDPISLGLVASLNRPGGNATGVAFMTVELTAKRLSLLHELAPGAAHVVALVDPNYALAEAIIKDLQEARATLGLQVEILYAGTAREIDAAFTTMVQKRADALLVTASPFFTNRRVRIVTLVTRHALPVLYDIREFAEAGGLMSYGPSFRDIYQQAGIYTGRILKGERPADLPVMQPTKFELVINLTTARALGITVPNMLSTRRRGDRVVATPVVPNGDLHGMKEPFQCRLITTATITTLVL
jgi:ABC-type uncharacterized transport system substrate-binding protein/transposase